MNFSEEEREEVYLAVSMRICWIETGTISMRTSDAIRAGQPKLVKALSRDQRDLVRLLEDAMVKLLVRK